MRDSRFPTVEDWHSSNARMFVLVYVMTLLRSLYDTHHATLTFHQTSPMIPLLFSQHPYTSTACLEITSHPSPEQNTSPAGRIRTTPKQGVTEGFEDSRLHSIFLSFIFPKMVPDIRAGRCYGRVQTLGVCKAETGIWLGSISFGTWMYLVLTPDMLYQSGSWFPYPRAVRRRKGRGGKGDLFDCTYIPRCVLVEVRGRRRERGGHGWLVDSQCIYLHTPPLRPFMRMIRKELSW